MTADVTLTSDQIHYLDDVARKRISQLSRSIRTAEDNHRAGVRIQHGTLEHHYKERKALMEVRELLQAANQEFVAAINKSLGLA